MRKSRITLLFICMVMVIGCTRKSGTGLQGNHNDTRENETISVIDMHNNEQTRSYSTDQDGLKSYVSDILEFDISEYVDDISGPATRMEFDLVARVIIKDDMREALLQKLADSFYVRDAEQIWLSDVGKYCPPGMNSTIQKELKNNDVIGYIERGFTGIHQETRVYYVYIVEENEKLVLLILLF